MDANIPSSDTMNDGSTRSTSGGRVRLAPQQSPQRGSLSLAVLRRSSPHHTPTRTLQLSEQEIQQAAANENSQSNFRVTIESLTQRPRSNQRNRTPRRSESPLDPDEFRRQRPLSFSSSERLTAREEPRRITIRPAAGVAVGTVQPTRVSPFYTNMQTPLCLLSSSSSLTKLNRLEKNLRSDQPNKALPTGRFGAGTTTGSKLWLPKLHLALGPQLKYLYEGKRTHIYTRMFMIR